MKKRHKTNSKLEIPIFIVKSSKRWYKNTCTGEYIATDKIDEYLLNKTRDTEIKPVKEYWWNKD